jgi:hypothetical protein
LTDLPARALLRKREDDWFTIKTSRETTCTTAGHPDEAIEVEEDIVVEDQIWIFGRTIILARLILLKTYVRSSVPLSPYLYG